MLACSRLAGADPGVGARVGAHPWDGAASPFKIHYSIASKHQSITGRHPLGEILYPPLIRPFTVCFYWKQSGKVRNSGWIKLLYIKFNKAW